LPIFNASRNRGAEEQQESFQDDEHLQKKTNKKKTRDALLREVAAMMKRIELLEKEIINLKP
jgi:uncharacterized small protein (DUF1192 family)